MTREEGLTSLLSQLPEMERACIGLHYQGYSDARIAETVHIPVEKVCEYIYDAIARVSPLLKDSNKQFHTLLDDD